MRYVCDVRKNDTNKLRSAVAMGLAGGKVGRDGMRWVGLGDRCVGVAVGMWTWEEKCG